MGVVNALKGIGKNSLSSPLSLMQDNYGNKFIPGKHLTRIDKALVKLEKGKIEKLAVFMPPRHGKSETISRYFPAWYLMRNPDSRVILVSHSADLAEEFSADAREIFRRYSKTSLRQETSQKREWYLEYPNKGGLIARGIGGSITGISLEVKKPMSLSGWRHHYYG